MVLHLDVGREKSVKALEKAMVEDNLILLCSQSEVNIEEPTQDDIFGLAQLRMYARCLSFPTVPYVC